MAHLAESQKQLPLACSFYKRFYLCARVLNNPVDAGLALNRLGTLYGRMAQYKVSLQYHLKHLDMLTGPERFIAKYNVALAMRMCGKSESARNEIQSAIKIVEERNVSFSLVSLKLGYRI